MHFFIKNRNELKIAVVVENPEGKGLAFVMHGLGGFKEQPHIRTFIEAFLERDFVVVSFDATHSFGKSDGLYQDATTTNYYHDLEDVIVWARKQKWYNEPFILAGHSLGSFSSILFAERYPKKVKALAPISTVVSGKLSLVTHTKKELEEWERTGWLFIRSNLGIIKKLKWSHLEDRLKYDVLPTANKLKMPVLLIVGDKDTSTPLKHQKLLYDALPGEKELHIIRGAPHALYKEHFKEIKQIFLNWLDSLENLSH